MGQAIKQATTVIVIVAISLLIGLLVKSLWPHKAATTSAEPWKNDPIVRERCTPPKDKPWECDPIVKP